MSNFIHEFWRAHSERWNHDLIVRFPPEPNGYLHLGHAKAILANNDLIEEFGGSLLLRMDDTNPSAEKPEFEHAIIEDMRWLGAGFDARVRYASDHFEELKSLALCLIRNGEAYVDTSSKEEITRMRGSFHASGVPSIDRDLPIDIHIARFEALCDGKLKAGDAVLRARLDMSSTNMVLRDPVLWRGIKESHPRLPGWHAMPTYDFAHPFCDVRDGVSLSLCSLEFEDHRPLYERVVKWALDNGFGLPGRAGPVELEFARLEPDGGMTSKRKLKTAIESGEMGGWDDPRLLTLSGLRARGYTPEMIKKFVRRLGVNRSASVAPLAWLDEEVRNCCGMSPAALIVPDPMLLHLSGAIPTKMRLPSGDHLPVDGNTFWVCADDIRLASENGFFRLAPGNTVRLMGLGGFAIVDRVEGVCGVLEVWAHYEPTGKSKATIHCLPIGAACSVVIERITTWDGASCADDAWIKGDAMVEPGAPSHAGVFHAPRVGWGGWAENGAWRWLATMKA
jgi:glutaminyl-tRNA synthetase